MDTVAFLCASISVERNELAAVVPSACDCTSVVLRNGRKPLKTVMQTWRRNVIEGLEGRGQRLYVIDSKDGERGRNRTYNLLIKRQREHVAASIPSAAFTRSYN